MSEEKAKSAIYPLLDYFSGIFEGTTIAAIGHWIGVDHFLPEFLGQSMTVPTAQMMYFCYRFQHIKFFVPFLDVQRAALDGDFRNCNLFNYEFRSIKLDISGDGLQWLRGYWQDELHRDIDVDSYLRLIIDERTGVGKFHITRCDFAFDLINYNSSFLEDCIAYCDCLRAMKIKRISCGGVNSGLKFSCKDGSEESTLYLGTTYSDNFLRIYDKKLEYTDECGAWKKLCPYGEGVDSWIRIELQTRRDKAHALLYSSSEASLKEWQLGIFRWIYDRFAFMDRDYTKTTRAKGIESFWVALFDWKSISKIICNKNFVEFVKPTIERTIDFIEGPAFSSVVTYFSYFGVADGIDRINCKLMQLSKDRLSNDDVIASSSSLSYNHLTTKLLSVDSLDMLPGLDTKNNILQLRSNELWLKEFSSVGT